jgi:hypothetical protein
MQSAEEYADIIMRDEREKIVTETPTVYREDRIERIYEFADGAVVRYEWQNAPAAEPFNHRWTLVELPAPNPHRLKKGIIKVVNYSDR